VRRRLHSQNAEGRLVGASTRDQGWLNLKMTKLKRLQRVNRKAQSASRADLPVVITRQCYALSLLLDKVHRREMKSIERSDWLGKRFQSARQDRQGEFDKRNPSQQSSHFVAMGAGELTCVGARPNLILDRPTGNQRLLPERFKRGCGGGTWP
jgi:hypothetical protein